MKRQVPRISAESSTIRRRAEQRRGWRDKTILSLQKSQSASVRLVGRWRITATVVQATFKTANTKIQLERVPRYVLLSDIS